MVRSIPHRGHTLGFRVESAGRVVAYLPDHQAPVDRRSIADGVLELCAGADLVIHDAQYTDEEFVNMSDWGHSTVAYAVHVATEAGARRLALFHHDPSHTDKEMARARRLGAQYRLDDVTAASEGWTIDLGKA
jgi:ribonuclease BN (tRNA processing enzyme)